MERNITFHNIRLSQLKTAFVLLGYGMSQLKTNICTVERDSADTSAVPQQIHIAAKSNILF